jgi:autotransporter family porin
MVFLITTLLMATASTTLPNPLRVTWSFLSDLTHPMPLNSSATPGDPHDKLPKLNRQPTTTKKAVAQERYFGTLPPGTRLPTDAQCAAAVKPRPETTPANKPFNARRGRQRLARNFFTSGDKRANRDIAARVTGNFVGTTDEIIQWAACKWGIDEDIVRAQVAVESKWQQLSLGDWHTNPERCPPGHRPGVDGRRGQCPESWGLMQVKYRFYRSAWPGSARSTAFNLDTAYAVWRACYEGYEWWLNDVEHGKDYAAGDVWGCIGRWYSGRWHTAPAIKYIQQVQQNLATRLWEQASFRKP